MQFDTVLRTFSEFFEREGIRYAVVGGLAMQAWGASRFTKDVDFVVEKSDQSRVVAFAESIGYETLNVAAGYSNHLHPDRDWDRIDFLYIGVETARQVLGESVIKPVIGDLQAPVARPEHLAMMKALAIKNAPQRVVFEGNDIALLLKLPGVDRKIIRDYFAKHDLLDLFNAIDKAR